jgi:hypothetical protein
MSQYVRLSDFGTSVPRVVVFDGVPTSTSDDWAAATTRDSTSCKPKAIPRAVRVLENAVYMHIRAIRTLGRTTINTTEIASALEVSLSDVESTLRSLEKKGVKVLR